MEKARQAELAFIVLKFEVRKLMIPCLGTVLLSTDRDIDLSTEQRKGQLRKEASRLEIPQHVTHVLLSSNISSEEYREFNEILLTEVLNEMLR